MVDSVFLVNKILVEKRQVSQQACMTAMLVRYNHCFYILFIKNSRHTWF